MPPENYKHLYEQMKKTVQCYQDEIVPGLWKQLNKLKQENAAIVLCKDCTKFETCLCPMVTETPFLNNPNDFCSYGEKKDGGNNDG